MKVLPVTSFSVTSGNFFFFFFFFLSYRYYKTRPLCPTITQGTTTLAEKNLQMKNSVLNKSSVNELKKKKTCSAQLPNRN
jgi:hypothetical protein